MTSPVKRYPQSPAPGCYDWQPPIIFEDDLCLEELDEILQQVDSDGELEVTPEDAAVYRKLYVDAQMDEDAKLQDPVMHAKTLKAMMRAKKVLNFDKKLKSADSVSSYETDDYMSQPSQDAFETEVDYIDAIQARAQSTKKLRKLIEAADRKSPIKSPKKSPIKHVAERRAVVKALQRRGISFPEETCTPCSPKKIKSFSRIQLSDSDSDEAVPLPKAFNAKLAAGGKKTFFATPVSASPAKSSPIKPFVGKSFFKPVQESDSSDEDFGPKFKSPLKVQSKIKKKFFASPAKYPADSPTKHFGKITPQDIAREVAQLKCHY